MNQIISATLSKHCQSSRVQKRCHPIPDGYGIPCIIVHNCAFGIVAPRIKDFPIVVRVTIVQRLLSC